MVVLGHNGAGRLELVGRYELVLNEQQQQQQQQQPEGGEPPTDGHQTKTLTAAAAVAVVNHEKGSDRVVVGYKFHKRLRVLPPKVVRKVKIRLCADDDG